MIGIVSLPLLPLSISLSHSSAEETTTKTTTRNNNRQIPICLFVPDSHKLVYPTFSSSPAFGSKLKTFLRRICSANFLRFSLFASLYDGCCSAYGGGGSPGVLCPSSPSIEYRVASHRIVVLLLLLLLVMALCRKL